MVTIEHASVHATDPRRAAEHLAALVGGHAAELTPLRGAWACLFDRTWNGPFVDVQIDDGLIVECVPAR